MSKEIHMNVLEYAEVFLE